ncbi:MAG: hypothetical protein K9M49_08115, partial [Candidatus Marinimicrobia bacterium]|nr:hypothetical protein [Candidatus Neomarinimicrobiota bacterium]
MRKKFQSNLVKGVVSILMSAVGLFAENSFTLSGTNIVANYWNSTNDGAQVKAQSFEPNIAQYKTYIRVDGGAYVQIAGASGGAATFGQLDFSLSAADIENTDPLSDGESFNIYVEFLDGSAAPLDTITCTTSPVTVDQTAPTILSISSSSNNGEYAIDEIINVQVNFSEAVSLSGSNSLQITLETGTVDETLSITTLSNSATAASSYTVASGDVSSDLSVNTVGLSSGTLRDQAGNDAVTSIPGGNNLNDNSDLVVDGQIPNAIDLASGAGTVVSFGGTVKANFWNSTNTSLKVTVPIANDASLMGGQVQLKGYWGSVGGAQNLDSARTITAIAEDKTITILAADFESFPSWEEGKTLKVVAQVSDKAGNTSTLGSESDNEIKIDQTAPTISNLTSTTDDGYLNLTSPAANITITFNEAVTLLTDDLEIELETGTTDRTVAIGPFASSTSASGSYTVQSGDLSSDLTANSVSLAGGASIRDAAGNDVDLSIPGGENLGDYSDLIVDGVTATILSVTSSSIDGSYPIGEDINVTVTFSEPLTLSGGNTLDVSLDAGRVVNITSFTSTAVVSGTYTVQSTDASSDLAASGVAKSGGTLTDDAGNEADLSSIPTNISDGSDILVDGVVPSTVDLGTGAGTVVAAGGTAVADYWNSTNTSLNVSIPIAAGEGLIGGTIQLLGYWGVTSAGAVNLGSEVTITVQGSNQSIPITANTLENFGGFAEDGELKIVAVVTDPAGNTSAIGTASDNVITIDQTAPTLSSISSTTDDGYLNLSSPAANVTLTFSEAVTLANDNLKIQLETGATDRFINITPFATSTSGSASYSVQTGDISSDLSANTVSLVGAATLRDAAGNDADLSIPGESNLDDNSDLVVDGVTATILSVTSTTADGSYPIGEDINITVTFSEPLTLSGGNTLDVTLDVGRTVSISSFTSTTVVSGTYTVQSTDESSDLAASGVAKSGGTLTDDAGNEADLSSIPTNISAASAIVVDGVVPSAVNMSGGSVVALGGTVVTDYWNSTNTFLSVTVPIAAGEGLIGGTIQLQGYWGATAAGAVDLGGPVTTNVQGADQIVQIPANTLENFGGFGEDEVLKIIAIVTDPAGNSSTPGDASSNEITVDQTSPTVSGLSSTTNDGYLNLLSPAANVTVTFSEAVTLANNNLQVQLETGATDRTVSISPFASSLTCSGSYTVQTGDISSDLSVNSLSLAGGATLRDAAGNNASLAITEGTNLDDNSDLVVDGVTATILSVTSTTANGSYAVGENVNVTVTFSEPLTLSGGNTLDVTLDVGRTVSISSFTSTDVVSGTYTVQNTDESNDLAATGVAKSGGTLTDDAGNEADLSSIATNIDVGRDIVIDGVVPNAVNMATGAGTVASSGGTEVATFWNNTNTNLDVSVPIAAGEGLVGGTIQVKGYWGATSAGALDLGDPATITVTGANQTVQVPASALESFGGFVEGGVLKLVAVVTDPAGNTSSIGTESDDEITIDQIAPSVNSLTSTTNDGYLNLTSAAANVRVTFSEAVTLTGGALKVELETGSIDRTVSISAFGPSTTANGNYTVQAGDVSADLTAKGLSLSTPGTTLRDNAGNSANLTIQAGTNLGDNSNLIVDGVVPTITSITSTSNDDYYMIDDQIDVTITFSENVSLSGGNNLLIALDAGQSVTISSLSNTNQASGTYTVVALDESDDLTATGVSKDGGTLTDAAGNEVNLSGIPINIDAGSDIIIDGVAPANFTVNSVVTVGAPIVVGYWNAANTGMTVNVPVLNDASLVGGTIQIQGFYGNISGAENIGSARNITAGMLGTTQPISITSAGISSNVGFNEGQELKITAAITDIAGNTTTGTESANDFIIDETAPTIPSITSVPTSGTFKETDQIDITINFSENVYLVNGNLETTLETGDVLTSVPADLNGVNSVTETYTVGQDDASSDLSVTSTALSAGTLRDIAGNNAVIRVPQAGTNLSDNSN